MNAQRTDAMAAVTHLRPMRESDLDEIMRIEVRAYPFPWTRGIFRDCMHAGYPMIDDLLAVLYTHPQVYVDVGVIAYTQPRPAFYRYLQAIFDAGFGKRVMYGSDNMVWPETIERSIRVIEEAPFLNAQQKRAILYDNAARFLRLNEEQMRKHRSM